MAYPPPSGGYYPNPPSQGGQCNLGFSTASQPGQGTGYSLYPPAGGGFPCPPSIDPPSTYAPTSNAGSMAYQQSYPNPSAYPPQQGMTPYPPGPGAGGSTYPPAPGMGSSPYPPAPGMGSSPYPPAPGMGSSPYPPAPGMGSSPYPPAPGMGSSPYPPGPGASPYPPSSGAGSSPYPPGPGSSPYPPAPGASPYPPSPGMGSSPYPPGPGAGSSPYPPGPGAGSSPYPPGPGMGSSPYPPAPGVGSSPYPPGNTSFPQTNQAYPSSGSPHPPVSNYPNAGASPYQQSTSFQQSTAQSYQSGQSNQYQGAMWPYQERPTIRPSPSFDASSDAALLRKAMKGFGTDEAAIIQILGRRTGQERQQIIPRYQQSHGRELIKDLRSELGGDFGYVVDALMMPLPEYLAREVNKAIVGVGTNERALIEVLCTNDNNTLRAVKGAYQYIFKRPIENDLKGDTSGYFGRLMVAMAAAYRDEANTNASLAPGLAQNLYSAGVKKLGTDEGEFIRIMSTYSYPLLRCVFEEYRKISGGKSFDSAIKSELSGDLENGMLAIYECINNRAGFFAKHLHEAMAGMGTRDQNLIRIIVWRSEIDMGNIKDEYLKMYRKRLEDAIAGETSGDYKKMLLALVQG